MALIGIPIPETQCIGDSLDTLNRALTALNDCCESNGNNKVDRSGDTMQGDLNFNNYKITKFTAEVISKTAGFTLTPDHNGSIILVNSAAEVTVTVPQDVLTVGFNLVMIQMGTGGIKLGTAGTVVALNVSNALLTRKKYAQMNLAVVQANVVWISGDLI